MRGLIGTAGALLMLTVVTASASPITVNNNSFETPTSNNGGTNDVLDGAGWSGTGGSFGYGVYVPTSTQYSPGSDSLPSPKLVPDGTQAAYLSPNSSLIYNTLQLIQADTDYSIDFFVGYRSDKTFLSNSQIELTANGVVVGNFAITAPASGQWKEEQFTFLATSLTSYVGQTLGIAFVGGSTGQQANFDLVTINTITHTGRTPEPATLSLLGAGLAGLAVRRRRRKAA